MRSLFCAIAAVTASSALAWSWFDPGDRHAPPPPPPPQYGAYGYGQGPGGELPPGHGMHGGRHDRHDRRSGDHSRHSGFRLVGEFSPPGGGLEIPIGGGCSELYMEVSSGTVSFNTVVLRRGAQKQSVTIAARLQQGQRHSLPIDASVTGIRVSCSGKGRFKVYAR